MNNITALKSFSCLVALFLFSIVSGWAQCLPPTNLVAVNVNQISAQITYDAVNDATAGYEVELRTSGAPGSGPEGLFNTYTETSTTASFEGLVPDTIYTFYVRSRCGGTLGEWSTGLSIMTLDIQAPVALPATDITDVSFVARWESVAGATEYEVEVTEDAFDTFTTYNAGNNLLKLITDLTPETEYQYRVRAGRNNSNWSEYSNTIDVLTDNVESTIARWTSEGWLGEPVFTKTLKIEFDYNTGTDTYGVEGLLGKSIVLDPGIKFTIASGTFVQLIDNVINNSAPENFVIESNANLNQRGNLPNVNAVTVKRNSFPIYRLDYTIWSSPVSDQNLLAFSPQTVPDRFYSYNSVDDIFTVIPNVANESFVPGRGYLIRSPNTWVPFGPGVSGVRFPGKFVGIMNTHNILVPLNAGFNMVGNPFPTDISASSLVSQNSTIGTTLYFWRRRNNIAATGPGTSFYSTWSPFGSTGIYFNPEDPYADDTEPDGIIKVAQGFMVSTKEETVTSSMQFTRNMKTEDSFTDVFLKQNGKLKNDIIPVERHKIYLGLSGAPGISGTLLMGLASDAADGKDDNDGKYFGDSPIALTSLIGDESFVIQAKALPFENTAQFALRFQTSIADSYTITLGKTTGMFSEEVNPILIDMLTNTETNLRNSSYTFASEIGIFDTRFKIVFIENYLSNNDVVANANAVVVMSKDNILSINAGTYTINDIEIFDMLGRKIYSKSNIDASATSISDLRAQNQIILVQIATDHGVVTKKVQF